MMNKTAWACGILIALAIQPASARDGIPTTSGFSGYALVAPAYFSIASNTLVSGAPLLKDIGVPLIPSIFEAPSSQTAPALATGGELNYTFSGARTQFFFGNRLEDLLRLDVIFGLGVRQELPDESILAVSFLTTPLDLKFWADPYVEGEDRIQTGLNFPGVRLRWGRALGTGLELTVTSRWYRFDDEKSGAWLIGQGSLNPIDQPLLERDGNVLRLQALYRFHKKKHHFLPAIRYVNDDHRGDAVANTGVTLQLTYLYIRPGILLDTNILYGMRRTKETHPVYGETLDSDRFGAGLTAFITLKKYESSVLSLYVGGEIFREDANVDFFDSRLAMVTAGVFWGYNRK